MPVTYNLIASNTLSSSAASVTFSAIPNTYTDLVLKASIRNDGNAGASVASAAAAIQFNGVTTTVYSNTYLYAAGSTASTNQNANGTDVTWLPNSAGSNATANTFSCTEFYIPSYTASQNKPFSGFGAPENNSTSLWHNLAGAGLWRNTSAISSIYLFPVYGTNFVSGSSFFLYGIKNS